MMARETSNQLTKKELLLKEIEQTSEDLLGEVLDFLLFIKLRHTQQKSTAASLLKYSGTWQGDDLEDCLQLVHETRSQFYIANDETHDQEI